MFWKLTVKKYVQEETRLHFYHVDHDLTKHKSNVIIKQYSLHSFYQTPATKSTLKKTARSTTILFILYLYNVVLVY